MKNKIFWILSIIILLVSVFSMQIFGAFGGLTDGGNLYSNSTFIKPEYVFFDQLHSDDASSNGQALTIPFSTLSGGNGDLSCYWDNRVDIYADYSTVLDTQNRSVTRLEVYSDRPLYCMQYGIQYQDSTISFKDCNSLADYLFNNTDVCPTYISAIPVGLSGFYMSANVSVYNGNDVIYNQLFTKYSSASSSLIDRLVKPFFNDISSWVRDLDVDDVWHTMTITDCYCYSSNTSHLDLSTYDYFQIATFPPVDDSLNENLSFNSVVDTTVRYDLNPLSFIWDTLNSLFAIQLFQVPVLNGYLTIGELLMALLGFYGLVIIFKAFAGG